MWRLPDSVSSSPPGLSESSPTVLFSSVWQLIWVAGWRPAVSALGRMTNKEFPDINRHRALFGRSLHTEEALFFLRLRNTGCYGQKRVCWTLQPTFSRNEKKIDCFILPLMMCVDWYLQRNPPLSAQKGQRSDTSEFQKKVWTAMRSCTVVRTERWCVQGVSVQFLKLRFVFAWKETLNTGEWCRAGWCWGGWVWYKAIIRAKTWYWHTEVVV